MDKRGVVASMFENATTLQFRPGQVDQALRILREQVVPVVKRQIGLIHPCLLPDRAADKIVVVSLWHSQAHALALEPVSAYQKLVSKLDALLAQPPLDMTPADMTREVRALDQVHCRFIFN